MRCLLLSCACVVVLVGCRFESGGITTITNTTIDGQKINATRAFIVDGHGEFDCVKSTTGTCHYVLFVERCAGDGMAHADAPHPADASARTTRTQACGTRVVQRFTLPAGGSKLLGGLPPHLKLCVSHEVEPVAPDCAPRTG